MRPSVGIGVLVFASTVVLFGMIAGSGCTVLTNDSLPDDAGKFEGGDATAQTCSTCLADACTGQVAVCLTDPTCAALARCASKGEACSCSEATATEAGAADASTDSFGALGAFLACINSAARLPTPGGSGVLGCADDCTGTSIAPPGSTCEPADGGTTDSGTTDAGDAGDDGAASDAGDDADASADGSTDAGSTPVDPSLAACTSCVSGKCGDAKKACAIASECAAYLECAFAAADAAAADECGRQHATGQTAAVELATCTRVGCSDACGF